MAVIEEHEHHGMVARAALFLVCLPAKAGWWCDVRRTPRYDERPARVRGRPGARCSLATKECSAAARAHVPGCRDLPSGAAA